MKHTLGLVMLSALVGALAAPGCSALAPVLVAGSTAAETPSSVLGHVSFPSSLAQDAHIIPTGIGSVIAAGGARYRTLAVADGAASGAAQDDDPDLLVSGALVLALDPATRHPLYGIKPVHTDAQGHFQLDGVTGHVLVAAIFRSADGSRAFRLLALAHPMAPGGRELGVSWRSTAVVTALGPDALPGADPDDLAGREDAVARSFVGHPASERLDALSRTLGVDPALVPADDADPDSLPPLTFPSLPPTLLPAAPASPAPSSGPSGGTSQTVGAAVGGVTQAAGSTVGGVTHAAGTAVQGVTQTVASAVPGVVQTVASTVPSVVNTVASSVPVVGAVVKTASSVTAPVVSALPSPLASVLGSVTSNLPVVNTLLGDTATPTPTAKPTAKPTPAPLLPLPVSSVLHLL